MHDLSEVLHETEVCSHGISQASDLAEFWDQSNLSSGLAVLVNEEGLVRLLHILVVASLVVLFVADL